MLNKQGILQLLNVSGRMSPPEEPLLSGQCQTMISNVKVLKQPRVF